jgi:excisionase family DNA binding protein
VARQPIGFARGAETAAVFVRVPTAEAEKLNRASFTLKRPKREIVTALLSAMETEQGELVLGRAELPPDEPARSAEPLGDVLTLEEAAVLLRVEPETVRQLAEKGELPGRRLGDAWRFASAALLSWLAA